MRPRTEEIERSCWCGAETARLTFQFRHRGTLLRYVRCTGCGVLAQWPQVPDKTLAAAYAPEYYGATRKKFVGPIAEFVEVFQRQRARMVAREFEGQGSNPRVLDVGCGNGGFLLRLKALGVSRLEGTEYSAESAARIPRDSGITVHQGDLLSLGLPAESYDVITMFHVLEHLRNPAEALAECHRLLKPGGLIIIAVPNQDSNQAKRFGPHWFHLDPPRHLFGFGPRSLGLVVRRAGLNLYDLRTFSLEQDPYGWIQSLLNKWGFPYNRAYSTLKRTGKHVQSERLLDLALIALLIPYGLSTSIISAIVDRGATLTLMAHKD